jgi:hypothetical protein
MISEERVCELCSGQIPKWKAKGTKVCSAKCKFEIKEAKRLSKRTIGSLLHACLSNVLDPAKPHCVCKMRLSDEQARRMVAKGEAVSFDNRTSEYFEGAALLVTGKNLKFPRAATIERPHIERLVDDHSSKNKKKDQSVEALQKAVDEDRAMRAEEESLRLEIYGELTMKAWQQLIVEVPADQYDQEEREARGRCLFANYTDERTEGGIGVRVYLCSQEEEIEDVESVVDETNETDSEVEIQNEVEELV